MKPILFSLQEYTEEIINGQSYKKNSILIANSQLNADKYFF